MKCAILFNRLLHKNDAVPRFTIFPERQRLRNKDQFQLLRKSFGTRGQIIQQFRQLPL